MRRFKKGLFGEIMDHNPNLKPWRRPEPNQVAGKGKIEKPDQVENIIHQTRSNPPTEYENRLGDALMEIFSDDIEKLSEIVSKLNEKGIQTSNGAIWSEENFKMEMKRLGA
jgi:hypothetical protein